ncbi:MAG: hypothetical protein H0W28_03590 [Pyrinomonadaceae bacterium]|nr:hypothetical protein [Pyrinomonadaceae bacterium]
MRTIFAEQGVPTKYARAQLIAGQVSELSPLLPPPRKIWMSEDARMSLFEAAALAWIAYGEQKASAE